MYVVFAVLVFCSIGTLRARQPDIDINRIKLVPKEGYQQSTNYHSRRSIITNNLRRQHDYDNYSSRVTELRPSMQLLHNAPTITEAKTGKVYQPKEDPRLFYQSDAYIQEINRKNLNNQVSSVYLGRGVIRASDNPSSKSLPYRLRENEITREKDLCVQCPRDRTLIAKTGVDRAVLQYPRILTCSGRIAPRAVRFTRMYGPEFGTMLKEGSHMVVGRISYKGKVLKTCKMQVHVLLQSCPVPKYLIAHCPSHNKTCSFTCRDTKTELRGHKTLTCDNNMQWSGSLPVCNAHAWCTPPNPPEHGDLSCKGLTFSNGSRFSEGSSCRVKCAKGWRRTARTIAVCRRGIWTHELSCHRNHANQKKNVNN